MAGDVNREDRLPPGQQECDDLPIRHYGRVPSVDPHRWVMSFWGATADGQDHRLTLQQLAELPRVKVSVDLHCAHKRSMRNRTWEGIAARSVIDLFPPAEPIAGVMVFAQYGYSANLRLEDLRREDTVLATHLDGEPLSPERGWPVRLVVPHLYSWKGPKWFRGWEYLTQLRRGFWEERGYHLIGDVWQEQRYSFLE